MIWSMIANVGAYVAVSLSGRRPPRSIARPASSSTCSGTSRGRAVLARHGVGRRSAERAGALPRRGRRRPAFAEYARGRGLRWPDENPTPTPTSCTSSRPSSPGRSARPRRGSWWPPRSGGGADARRGERDPRRGVAGHRLQPPARAEIARARGSDAELARGQRAAAGTRPAQGRLHLDGDARAAHAAHVDPRVLRDPARRSDVAPAERQRFLGIITKETERLTRLINQVLDLAKLESGRAEWQVTRGRRARGRRARRSPA